MKLLTRILAALALASLGLAAPLAAEKPLIIVSGKIKQLPSATTIVLNGSVAGAASINIPHGTAPSSPNNGDCWTTTSGFFCRINGATVGPYGAATYSNEDSQDAVGGILTDTATVDFTYNDGANTITADVPTGSIGATQIASTAVTPGSYTSANITVDADGRVTAAANGSGGGYTAENARDDIGTALVAGTGITITPNDGADTITVTATAATPATTLISEVVTSGSQASVNFTSIASTWRDLEVRVRGRGTASATNVTVGIQFNGDTAANYDYSDAHWFGTSTAFTQSAATTSILIGFLTAATATANHAGGISATVYDYKGTTFFKEINATFGATLATTASAIGGGVPSGQWRSTAAITAVLVILSSGNFVNGSVVSLYGRM